MLQIYLYGPYENGFLDIDASVVLQMEGLSPLFDEDLSTGEFSLPVDLPWTDQNRRLFGFAERLENFNTAVRSFVCDVYDDGFPELQKAQLTILERSGQYSYRRGKFSVTIAGTQGLFGTLVKNKKVSDLVLDGPITFTAQSSRDFAKEVMDGQHPQHADKLAFAPVAIQDFVDASRPDYNGEFLVRDTVNHIVVAPGYPNGWTFGRPLSTNTAIAVGSGHVEFADYYTVPFFKLAYVIRKIFNEHGFVVKGDFIDGNDFKDLYLFNNCAIEEYAVTTRVDYNKQIIPQQHMPETGIADFLKQVFSLFCIYPLFVNNNEVHLIYRKDDFRNRKILSINNICSDEFTGTWEDVEEQKKGYEIKYEWDGADSGYSDKTKDLSDKNLVASVATTAALITLNIGRQLTTDDIAHVQADNLYYRVANATVSPVLWEPYAEGLYPYKSGQGERSVTVGGSPLYTHTVLNETAGLVEKYNYLGTKQKGTYRNFRGIRVKNEFGVRLFYIKQLPFGGVQYPVSFYHNRNQIAEKLVPYSLALTGEDGLFENFHREWQELRQRGEIVKTRIGVDKKVLQELMLSNTLERDNVLFLPYSLERTIPSTDDAEIQMMPL
ncbi:MAG TPA: hypothetical protein VEB42_02955 [Chitinophagaceae bacterium]|nr:hypothetical protein [Chitinophagaceae bacterium]